MDDDWGSPWYPHRKAPFEWGNCLALKNKKPGSPRVDGVYYHFS
jgi:hypothetical protein